MSNLLLRRRAPALVTLAFCVAGCSAPPRVLGIAPYRMEIQQGNHVSKDAVDRLKPGMTKEQVRFVLGTPLVTDIFHANRWDYPYYRDRTDSAREEGRLVLFFDEGKLARVEGEALPGARPAGASGR
jgi:outer membrane protein assembly factor BamE